MKPSPFTHRIRVRYAEVDGQGVVFNAHWLTYFDDACTRFMESLGFGSSFWIAEFDVMLVKAVLEWSGPARFDEWVDLAVAPVRIGTKSFDLRFVATVEGRPACTATVTYVSVSPTGAFAAEAARQHSSGKASSTDIPGKVREALADRLEA
jgi:acyl-CoA thioester hydrolase